MSKFAEGWDKVAGFISDLSESFPADVHAWSSEHQPADKLVEMHFDLATVFGLRMQLLLHTLSSLGLQQFNLKHPNDPTVTAVPYMSQAMHKLVTQMSVMFDLSQPMGISGGSWNRSILRYHS